MKDENDLDVWIDHAEDDFNAAGKLLRGKKPSIYGACFHAQQCAEKYIKAMLVVKVQRFPMTHDLVILNTLLQQAGIDMMISEDLLELFVLGRLEQLEVRLVGRVVGQHVEDEPLLDRLPHRVDVERLGDTARAWPAEQLDRTTCAGPLRPANKSPALKSPPRRAMRLCEPAAG